MLWQQYNDPHCCFLLYSQQHMRVFICSGEDNTSRRAEISLAARILAYNRSRFYPTEPL